MAGFRALLIRRAFADNGATANEGGLALILKREIDRSANAGVVVAVDIWNNLPAITLETFGGIVGEPPCNFAVYGNTVVVLKRDEFA